MGRVRQDKRNLEAWVTAARRFDDTDVEAASLDDGFDALWATMRDEAIHDNSVDDRLARRDAAVAARRPRHRRRVVIIPVAVAVALAASGAAGAGAWRATHTGIYSSRTSPAGPGEALDPGGTNFPQVARKLAQDIPYPEDGGPDGVIRFYHASAGNGTGLHDTGALVTTSTIRGDMVDDSICQWTYHWLTANKRGDPESQRRITKIIVGALDWPAVKTLDPDPHGPVPNPTPEPNYTRFWYLDMLGDAVSERDVERVRQITRKWVGPHCMQSGFEFEETR